MKVEGFAPGTRAYRNNNPGNIWDGIAGGKTQRIWPNLPIDPQGFVIYPSYEAGYSALLKDLGIKINRGMTLEQLITMYAPAKGDTVNGFDLSNNTSAYIQSVARQTGLPTNVPLQNIATGGAGEPPEPADNTFPALLPVMSAGGSIIQGVDDAVVIGAVIGLAVLVWIVWKDA